jgi:hypothetical protein
MKLWCLACVSALAYGNSKPHAYVQSSVINRDHIEVVYLPNNTCHINAPVVAPVDNYKDLVRACLNNRHLRIKIGHTQPN